LLCSHGRLHGLLSHARIFVLNCFFRLRAFRDALLENEILRRLIGDSALGYVTAARSFLGCRIRPG
jgi:hypothetical protein